MAHRRAVPAARSLHGPLVHREHDGVTLLERDNLTARLHARPLLDQHELAAVEILFRPAQQHCRLQWEDHLAVEIAVEAVVVAGAVLQQQRRRPGLAGFVTLL